MKWQWVNVQPQGMEQLLNRKNWTYIIFWNPSIFTENFFCLFSRFCGITKIFIDSFPLENSFIEKFNGDNPQNLFYQKDNIENWHSLFKEKPIKGSECVILQPILINEVLAGVIVVRSDHFSNVNEYNQKIIKHLADIITIGILDLDILEKTISCIQDMFKLDFAEGSHVMLIAMPILYIQAAVCRKVACNASSNASMHVYCIVLNIPTEVVSYFNKLFV